MSTRRCSVLYVVPYIHSDDSRRLHARGRPAASLHEEQHPGHAHLLHPQDAGVHTQRGAWVTTPLTTHRDSSPRVSSLTEWLHPLLQVHRELQLRQLPQPAPSLHPEPVPQPGPRAGHRHAPPLLCLPQVVCTGQCLPLQTTQTAKANERRERQTSFP